VTITINYDDSTVPSLPVDGTIKLEIYNQAGAKTGTENMAFTFSNPG